MFADRIIRLSILFATLICFGCQKDAGEDGNSTAAAAKPSAQVAESQPERHASPGEAVSHFLTALKNGDDEQATALLTSKAQSEMQRTEAAIKPPGSPTAEFKVTEVEILGEQKSGAHVLSIWSDTDEAGMQQTYEIVWILRKESEGWAIAGMATRVFEDRDPLILNFEDPLEAQRQRNAVDQEIARRSGGEQIRHAQGETPVRR
jgi:hypothetical protein